MNGERGRPDPTVAPFAEGGRVAETVAEILHAYRTGAATPADIVKRSFARLRARDDPAMFISFREESDVLAEAQALAGRSPALPLYGIPVAVKDNIDVAGLPTTAACPAFLYHPARDATAVARLRAAGALVIGKTNLDQFATGLVGVRSPYGTPRNLFDPALIPGGSSSGSGVAVGAGVVPLALGTDTAGSGRVPAAFNNIVGLKPSLGLIPTTGVVPACRSLDCVSIFALTVDDAVTACRLSLAPIRTMPSRVPALARRRAAHPASFGSACRRPGNASSSATRRQRSFDAALAPVYRLGAKWSKSIWSRSSTRRGCSTKGLG